MVVFRDGHTSKMARIQSWNSRKRLWSGQLYRQSLSMGGRTIYAPAWDSNQGIMVGEDAQPGWKQLVVTFKTDSILCSGFNLEDGEMDDRVKRFTRGQGLTVMVMEPQRKRLRVTVGRSRSVDWVPARGAHLEEGRM